MGGKVLLVPSRLRIAGRYIQVLVLCSILAIAVCQSREKDTNKTENTLKTTHDVKGFDQLHREDGQGFPSRKAEATAVGTGGDAMVTSAEIGGVLQSQGKYYKALQRINTHLCCKKPPT